MEANQLFAKDLVKGIDIEDALNREWDIWLEEHRPSLKETNKFVSFIALGFFFASFLITGLFSLVFQDASIMICNVFTCPAIAFLWVVSMPLLEYNLKDHWAYRLKMFLVKRKFSNVNSLSNFCTVSVREDEENNKIIVSLLKKDYESMFYYTTKEICYFSKEFVLEQEEDALEFIVELREKAVEANELLHKMAFCPEQLLDDNGVEKQIDFRGFADRAKQEAAL